MYVHRHHHMDHELLKWLILVTLAGTLVLLATRPTSGDEVATSAEPNPVQIPFRINKSTSQSSANINSHARLAPTARRIRKILELHEHSSFDRAISKWEELSLMDRGSAWRAVGVATAYLQSEKLDDANCILSDACRRGRDNPVSHHLLGVVYSTKARIADRNGKRYLAEELRERARTEFDVAIATAGQVDINEPLCKPFTKFIGIRSYDTIYPMTSLPPLVPTIEDLLHVLELDNFGVKARIGLARLNMEQGLLADAEDLLDAIAETGADNSELFIALGEAYERKGQSMAAVRAMLKSMNGKAKASETAISDHKTKRANPLELLAPQEVSY